jgi:hypothetical protein
MSQHGLLPSQQGLCAHRKPIISWGIGFVDNFQGGCDSVFGDDYRVKGNVRRDKSRHQLGKQFWW